MTTFRAGALLALMFAACDGRPNLSVVTAELGHIAGTAIKGRVNGATVRVFRLQENGERAEVGTATTAEDGTFKVGVGKADGPMLVIVKGGSFVDEASGAVSNLNNDELTALVPSFRIQTKLDGVLVTPVSHFVATLALRYARTEGKTLPVAYEEATRHLNEHFGRLEWQTVVPGDLTSESPAALDGPGRAGLLLSALSAEARTISLRAGVTPGAVVTAMTLVKALGDDLGFDGYFDGVGPVGQIILPLSTPVVASGPSATKLDGQSVRVALGQAIESFLDGERNRSKLTFLDAQALARDISRNSNPRLFREAGLELDSEPPEVVLRSANPPRSTGLATLELTIGATDKGTSVARVLGSAGNAAQVVASKTGDGDWLLSLPLALGENTVVVWAEDVAVPANSGRERREPYRLEFAVTRDGTGATPSFESVASYFDESRVKLKESSPGVPVTPVEYDYSAAPKATLPTPSGIYKFATRLGHGSLPTAQELEGENVRNTPFLKVAVDYNAQVDSPITSATFSIVCTNCLAVDGGASADVCMGDNCPVAVGGLLPAGETSTRRTYLLPLSTETIPFLDKAQSPLELSIKATIHDAAGNAGVSSVQKMPFHVIGPPVSWREDENYRTSVDPKSASAYRISTGSLVELYSPSNAVLVGQNHVRLLKYEVRNPTSVPVALRLSFTGPMNGLPSWSAFETWSDEVFPVSGTPYSTFDVDSFTFRNQETWYDQSYWTSEPVACDEFGCGCGNYREVNAVYPCPPFSLQQQPSYPIHQKGNQATKFTCVMGAVPVSKTGGEQLVQTSKAPTTLILDSSDAPVQTAGGAVIVPAAMGTNPGVVVVYVVRKFDAARMTPPLVFQRTISMGTTSRFEKWVGDFWEGGVPASPSIWGLSQGNCQQLSSSVLGRNYSAKRWLQVLVGARERIDGQLSVETHGLRNVTEAFGEPGKSIPPTSLGLNMQH